MDLGLSLHRHETDRVETGVITPAQEHWKSGRSRAYCAESMIYRQEVAFIICHPYHDRMDFKELQLLIGPLIARRFVSPRLPGPPS